jgi:hypothetical protein
VLPCPWDQKVSVFAKKFLKNHAWVPLSNYLLFDFRTLKKKPGDVLVKQTKNYFLAIKNINNCEEGGGG